MLHELNSRTGDGITVTLSWDSTSGRTLIHLVDDRTEIDEAFEVAPSAAADAFDHPYYYFGWTASAEPAAAAAPVSAR